MKERSLDLTRHQTWMVLTQLFKRDRMLFSRVTNTQLSKMKVETGFFVMYRVNIFLKFQRRS